MEIVLSYQSSHQHWALVALCSGLYTEKLQHASLMTDLNTLPPLRDVIATHNLRAEKSFGQNFLLDLNLTAKIARQAGSLAGKHVIEIGPGPGGLTRALLASDAENVTAIEFDPRCIEALQSLKEASRERLALIHGDALETNLTATTQAPRCIIANLPYNIATPLLIKWLRNIYDSRNTYDAMVLMFQKEVAERIVASPGNKAYGRLAVISQWLTNARIVMNIPPSAFTPAPKVHSSVVLLTPRKERLEASFETVEKVTAKAFGQRRKMLRQSLKNYLEYFDPLEIDPTARPEDLPHEKFIQLANII